jgi:hypothetical protein
MFCVHCGAAVSEGTNFCGGCGRPVSAADASPLASIKGAMTFRNIRIMNIVGAAGMALLWVVVILGTYAKMPPLALAIFSFLFLVMVAAPVVSALALSQTAGKALRWIAVGLNVALILLWVLGVVQGLLHPSSQLLLSVASAVFYVVPQVVNIRALRAIGANTSMQQA